MEMKYCNAIFPKIYPCVLIPIPTDTAEFSVPGYLSDLSTAKCQCEHSDECDRKRSMKEIEMEMQAQRSR